MKTYLSTTEILERRLLRWKVIYFLFLITCFIFLLGTWESFGQTVPCDEYDAFVARHSDHYNRLDVEKFTTDEFIEYKRLKETCDEYKALNNTFENPDGATSITLLGGISSIGTFIKPSTSILLKVPATQYMTFNLFAGYVWESTNETELNNYWYQTEIEVTSPDEFNCGLGFTFYLTNK